MNYGDDAPLAMLSGGRRGKTTRIRSKASLLQVKEDVSRLIRRVSHRELAGDGDTVKSQKSSRSRTGRSTGGSDSHSSSSPGNVGSSITSSSTGAAVSTDAAASTGRRRAKRYRNAGVQDKNRIRETSGDSLEQQTSGLEQSKKSTSSSSSSLQASATTNPTTNASKKSSDGVQTNQVGRKTSILNSLKVFLEGKRDDGEEQGTKEHSTESNSKQSLDDPNSNNSESTTSTPKRRRHRAVATRHTGIVTTLSREEVIAMRRSKHRDDSRNSRDLSKKSGHSQTHRKSRSRQNSPVRNNSVKSHRSKNSAGRKGTTPALSESTEQKDEKPEILILIERPEMLADSKSRDKRRARKVATSGSAKGSESLKTEKRDSSGKSVKENQSSEDRMNGDTSLLPSGVPAEIRKPNKTRKANVQQSQRVLRKKMQEKPKKEEGSDGSPGEVSKKSDTSSLDPSLLRNSATRKVKSISELFDDYKSEKKVSAADTSYSLTSLTTNSNSNTLSTLTGSLGSHTRSTISSSLIKPSDGVSRASSQTTPSSSKRSGRETRTGTSNAEERSTSSKRSSNSKSRRRRPTTPITEERVRQRRIETPDPDERSRQRRTAISNIEERNRRRRMAESGSADDRFAWVELPLNDPIKPHVKSANLDGSNENLEGSSDRLSGLIKISQAFLATCEEEISPESSRSNKWGTTHSCETRSMGNLQMIGSQSDSSLNHSPSFLKRDSLSPFYPMKVKGVGGGVGGGGGADDGLKRSKHSGQRPKSDRDRSDKRAADARQRETSISEEPETAHVVADGTRPKNERNASESKAKESPLSSGSRRTKYPGQHRSRPDRDRDRDRTEKRSNQSRHREKRLGETAETARGENTRSEKERNAGSDQPRDESEKKERHKPHVSSSTRRSDPPGFRRMNASPGSSR